LLRYLVYIDPDCRTAFAAEIFLQRVGEVHALARGLWAAQTTLDIEAIQANLAITLGEDTHWLVCRAGDYRAPSGDRTWRHLLLIALG